jgi:hypothetical protein
MDDRAETASGAAVKPLDAPPNAPNETANAEETARGK